MTIGIVGGTGREGRGLALRFALAGASVTIGSRDERRASEAAAELCRAHPAARIRGASNRQAIASSDVVVLATPFAHVDGVIAADGDVFRPGTLLIDVTVPVVFDGGTPRLVTPDAGSATEHIRAHVPGHVAVAGALKTQPAAILEDTAIDLACDDFVCGDSQTTRARAMAVVATIPTLRPVDAGPLAAARVLEGMTLFAIMLNRRHKTHGARFSVVGV